MDQITTTLSISNIRSARNCDHEQFTHIITVCQESIADNMATEVPAYSHFNLADGEYDEQTNGGECSFEVFEQAADTLRKALTEDENTTLIHCHAGVSRSTSVAAAALSAINNQSFSESIEVIKTERPRANPLPRLKSYAKLYAYIHTNEQSLMGVPQEHRPPEFHGVDTLSEFGK